MVRDTHLAQDVSQRVFLALADHAARLADGAVLSSWLQRTAHHISVNTIRTEVRRCAREEAAATINQILNPGLDPLWQSIAPDFDNVLCELSEPDRQAILLRYFQSQSAREKCSGPARWVPHHD